MAPTIVLKDGKLFLVLGSPGGPRIITTVANILMGVVDYGMNIQEAVNAPRFHHSVAAGRNFSVEKGFSPETVKALEGMGHHIEIGRGYGDAIPTGAMASASWSTRRRGERLGASDNVIIGKAVGF